MKSSFILLETLAYPRISHSSGNDESNTTSALLLNKLVFSFLLLLLFLVVLCYFSFAFYSSLISIVDIDAVIDSAIEFVFVVVPFFIVIYILL